MPLVPERMDLLGRKRYPRNLLFRLVLKEDIFLLDDGQKEKGRGYYVLKDEETLSKLRKRNVLQRYSKKTDFEKLFAEMEEKL